MMIFEDPTRKRWRVVVSVAVVVSLAVVGLTVLFVGALSRDAALPTLTQGWERVEAATTLAWDEEGVPKELLHEPVVSRERHAPVYPQPLNARGPLLTAFLVQDDPHSLRRLCEVGRALDVVFPDCFTFDTSDGAIRETVDKRAMDLQRQAGAAIMPRISNTTPKGVWSVDAVSELLARPDAQARWVENLVDRLTALKAAGVNIDIESLEASDSSRFLDFLELAAESLHRHGMYLTVDVPLNEEQYDYEAIGKIADAVVVMAYDEHYSTGKPGPIAGLEWFADGVREYVKRLPSEKLIVAIGAYGYDWPERGAAEVLSFEQAIGLAQKHRASIQTPSDSVNSAFAYVDGRGVRHNVSFLDAVSVWNEVALISSAKDLEADPQKLLGVSVWRLGLEDTGIWPLLARRTTDGLSGPESLRTVAASRTPVVQGEGQLFRVRAAADGVRAVSMAGRFVSYAEYTELPEPPLVEKLRPVGREDGQVRVALTFDDGPEPAYTGPLLDVLKKEDVPAAFFVVGSQVQMYPDLVRRELAEGHAVGNHTYLHPRLDTLPRGRLHEELNRTQRLVESITGRQTMLFRSPYDTDSSPSGAARLAAFAQVSDLGYVCVGANVGAEDYWPTMSPDRIVQQVLEQMNGPGPFVVCLHDAGGERSRTVMAVEKLIPALRGRGCEFVSLERLAGVAPGSFNPAVPSTEQIAVQGDRTLGAGSRLMWGAVFWVFLISTLISILRILGLGGVLVVDRRLRKGRSLLAPYRHAVTVLIPAYNESKVIARTVRAVLASAYPAVEVVVVDDGSSDGTAEVVEAIAAQDARVTLVRKSNGGKADALNTGLRYVTTEVVVVVDADTIILPTTVARLVAPFADPGVDAVCGNVQVGNVRNFLTVVQDVEYVTCQNYDRRAFDALNCIGVVPGATGAWRAAAVRAVGGYSHDTLTEDADLTIAVLRNGGRIVYAPEARSKTEVPETFGALYKQRFRWAYGTFQTLWKHRAAFGRGTLGWVGMPNHVVFQVLFPMLAPTGDAVLLYSIVTGRWGAVAWGYLMFIGMDLLGSGIALRLDGRSLWSLWVVLVQRFCHRQFMYFVTFSAALACLRGGRHGWNKLERRASVETAEA